MKNDTGRLNGLPRSGKASAYLTEDSGAISGVHLSRPFYPVTPEPRTYLANSVRARWGRLVLWASRKEGLKSLGAHLIQMVHKGSDE